MKPIRIIKGFYELWKTDAFLQGITLRSTRIPQNTALPYALVECKHIGHETYSGNLVLAEYTLTCTVYCGQDKQLANQISEILEDLVDYHLSFPISGEGAYVIGVWNDFENIVMDKDDDLKSRDVNIVKQQWVIKLSETKS
jgi:hypothetical protein